MWVIYLPLHIDHYIFIIRMSVMILPIILENTISFKYILFIASIIKLTYLFSTWQLYIQLSNGHNARIKYLLHWALEISKQRKFNSRKIASNFSAQPPRTSISLQSNSLNPFWSSNPNGPRLALIWSSYCPKKIKHQNTGQG